MELISCTDARKAFIKVKKNIRLLYVHTEVLMSNYNTLYFYLTMGILSLVIKLWNCAQVLKTQPWDRIACARPRRNLLGKVPRSVYWRFTYIVKDIKIYACSNLYKSTLWYVWAVASVDMMKLKSCKMPVVINCHVMASSTLARLPFSSHCPRPRLYELTNCWSHLPPFPKNIRRWLPKTRPNTWTIYKLVKVANS